MYIMCVWHKYVCTRRPQYQFTKTAQPPNEQERRPSPPRPGSLSGVDVLYVSSHSVHAGVVQRRALGGRHPVGTHGVVAHHHVVRVAGDEHGL